MDKSVLYCPYCGMEHKAGTYDLAKRKVKTHILKIHGNMKVGL